MGTKNKNKKYYPLQKLKLKQEQIEAIEEILIIFNSLKGAILTKKISVKQKWGPILKESIKIWLQSSTKQQQEFNISKNPDSLAQLTSNYYWSMFEKSINDDYTLRLLPNQKEYQNSD